MKRRIALRIALMMLALASLAGPAAAQVPGINVHLGARVGAFTPLGVLAETSQGDLKLKPGLGIGASIELDIPFSPINIRANVDAALGAKAELNDAELQDAEVDVVNFTGDLVFRPLPRIVVVQPYLLAGVGVKRYTLGGTFGFSEDRTSLTGHLGAGADFKVGPLAVLVEASDYISSFKNEFDDSSKLQNDVFLMVGFRIGML